MIKHYMWCSFLISNLSYRRHILLSSFAVDKRCSFSTIFFFSPCHLVDMCKSIAHDTLYVIRVFNQQGVTPCTFYLQNGHCKFGSTCKFDHPVGTMRYSPSASSLIDIPVAPYPVGSLLATLAPSSTSSELSKKESYSVRVPISTGNASTSSVGLIFSQTGSVSLNDVQLSTQSSVPLSSSRSTRQGSEVRRST